jgi:uncharacterized protein (UPF0333 family)
MFRNEAEANLAFLVVLVAVLSGITGFLASSQLRASIAPSNSVVAQTQE